MNDSKSMYKLEQIVRHDLPVLLPDCMYKIDNIHSSSSINLSAKSQSQHLDITQQVEQFLKNSSEAQLKVMSEVEMQQEQVLKQLEELKRQLQNIREDLQQNQTTCTPPNINVLSGTKVSPLNVKNIPTLVLNVNPANPPYSLLILKKLLKNIANIQVHSHLHSTVSNLPQQADLFSKEVLETVSSSSIDNIEVRLIWKDIGMSQLELMISNRTILGECNFLRYLARESGSLGYDEQNYEIDSLLDTCYLIASSKTKTARIQLVQIINKKLEKSRFLFGDCMNIVDVAAYSAIKQVTTEADINNNIKNWMKNCENI